MSAKKTESTPPEKPASQPTKDDPGQSAPAASTDGERSAEEIKADIEGAREDLGDTVAALAEKADVKAQTKKKAAETKTQVQDKVTTAAGDAKAKAQDFSSKAQGATPESASAAASQAAQTAKENPVPTAAIGALLLGFFIGWLFGRG